ncbi:MAG: ABC transporter permease [Chloroflexota bacterium]|nr:ABC transporter permease [Chloroflexota bacterium]
MIEGQVDNLAPTHRGNDVISAPVSAFAVPEETPQGRSWRGAINALRAVFRNRKAVIGALILLAFGLVAIFAPVISPGDPNDLVARRHQPPSIDIRTTTVLGVPLPTGISMGEHWFGTSGAGQDVFDQTVWGTRQSLSVGIAVGLLTTALAVLFGMTAGYFGGRVDDLLSLFTNVFLIIPTLPLLVVLVGFLGSGGTLYFIGVLAVTGWSWGARVLRAQTLSLREKDFVSAAEVSGESRIRIILGEIFPNMISIVAANMFGATIYAIGAMAALEFLGLGNPSQISWGTNLYWAANNGALLTGAWWTVVPSGVSIALVAFAFALVNYAVDEVTNPRLRALRMAKDALKAAGKAQKRQGRATPVIRHAN